MGDYRAARPLYERALAINEKALGPEHPSTARSLRNLAVLLLEMGELRTARPLFERALTIREKALGPKHLDTASSLNDLAVLLLDLGELRTARPLFERALAIFDKVLGPEHPSTAISLHNLARLLKDMGERRTARPLFERALAIMEKALGPEHTETATCLSNLARLLRDMGELRTARPLSERALVIFEKALGPEHTTTATSLIVHASLLKDMGDLRAARPLFERALAIREKVLGPEHADTATSLANLASLLQGMGDLRAARPLFERALAIREKVRGPEHPDTAELLSALGGLLMAMGNYSAALPLLHRASDIWEKVGGGYHVESLIMAANYDLHVGDHQTARRLFERALAILESVLGPEHLATADSLNGLATSLKNMGDLPAARTLYERALAIREKQKGPKHPETATSLNNLASLLEHMGDLRAARPLYERALAIREKALGPKHPDTGESLKDLGWLDVRLGRTMPAMARLDRSLAIEEHHLGTLMLTGTEYDKSAYLRTLFISTNNAVLLALKVAPESLEARRLALDTVLRRKARVLEASAEQHRRLRNALSTEDRPLLEDLQDWRSQFAFLLRNPPGDLDPKVLRAQIDEARREIDRLESTLASKSEAFATATRPVTIEGVRKLLPKQTALLELVVFVPFDGKIADRSKRWGAPRYGAFALPAKGTPQAVDLGEAAPIDEAARALRIAIANRSGDVKDKARTLHALVMAKVEPLLGKVETLIISPDGELAQVPFETMMGPDERWLVERYALSYLTTGRDLVRLSVRRGISSAPVLVGGIDYDNRSTGPVPVAAPPTTEPAPTLAEAPRDMRSADRAPGVGRYKYLPGAAREVEEIAQLPLLSGARVFGREQATEAALRALRGPRVLHLSTHGFFEPDLPEPPPVAAGESPWPMPQSENPLLRSGLALSGANRTDHAPDGDDGELTAFEASNLDLDGTELVILSACETAVGEVAYGDGVHGLQRAFVLAGARTLVMSLWKVDDEATRALMLAYYQRLAQGQGRAEAMRQVRLALLAGDVTADALSSGTRTACPGNCEHAKDFPNWTHPYYWASFIVAGDTSAFHGLTQRSK